MEASGVDPGAPEARRPPRGALPRNCPYTVRTGASRASVGSVERVVYQHAGWEVGAFRCPPERPDFRNAGAIRDHCVFVFPRTSVWIRHEGERAFLADPTSVTFYNPGQPYTRERMDPRGDRCDWFAVDPGTVLEAAGELDPALADRPGRPFRFSHGPSDSSTYLAQRRLFHRLAAGACGDRWDVAETLYRLLHHVLRLAYARDGARPAPRPPTAREREAVAHARRVLAVRFREPIPLGDLSAEVGLSRFRLCRAFAQVTGRGLHAYREELRLREGLERLECCGRGLTGLALDLGYSSHSHFTARFRRGFGAAPGAVRDGLASDRSPRPAASARPRPE
jgi:AraC family transcriptional regulator